MTQDEIIEMARQADIKHRTNIFYSQFCDGVYADDLEAFAKLVAAKEREKVAKWQIGSGYSTGHGETIEDLLVELEWQVRESEREACAKVCEQYKGYGGNLFAPAIRARGQA